MTDIVERLRKWQSPTCPLIGEAADEIETLRQIEANLCDLHNVALAENATLRKHLDGLIAALVRIASGEVENGSIMSGGEAQSIAYEALAKVKGE